MTTYTLIPSRHLSCVGYAQGQNVNKILPFGRGLFGYNKLGEADRLRVREIFERFPGIPLNDDDDDSKR